VIEQKYLTMLAQLTASTREDDARYRAPHQPGWLQRRTRDLPPASQVLAQASAGIESASMRPAKTRTSSETPAASREAHA
jgi:hypothetical protein